jgi:lipoprotein-releasing system permease protein
MYKLVLSTRYLFRRRISYLSLAAVSLCVFIVVVVMTVMTGLVGDLKNKYHDFTGDCVVSSESLVGFPYYEEFTNELQGCDYVEAISPVIKSYALVSAPDYGWSGGMEILGIDPERHSKATNFADTLHYRRAEVSKAFVPIYDADLPGCVLGIDFRLGRNSRGEYSYDGNPAK